jgi:hypothetical protein
MLVVSFVIAIFAANLLVSPLTQSGIKLKSMALCFIKLAYSISCRISPDVAALEHVQLKVVNLSSPTCPPGAIVLKARPAAARRVHAVHSCSCRTFYQAKIS